MHENINTRKKNASSSHGFVAECIYLIEQARQSEQANCVLSVAWRFEKNAKKRAVWSNSGGAG